jgi:hypothetical protein
MGFWPVTGLLVGFGLGLVIHRGDFCMHSALREALGGRPGESLRAYLLALGIQLGLVNTLAWLDLLAVRWPPVQPAAAVTGGLVFGVGMSLARG